MPVAAVDVRADSRFLPALRRHRVPVLVADARLPETLQAMQITTARCLVVATDDDVANLETALNARALNPRLRVVLRLFDPDLARRVERTFGIDISRSMSTLAAPVFAAAAVGGQVIATLPVGPRVLAIARLRVGAGGWADGRTIADLESETESRVLIRVREDRYVWRPPIETELARNHEIFVVATRAGLAGVLARVEAPAAPEQPAVGTPSGV